MISIDFILNGVSYREPVEWRDLEVLATFEGDTVQPNISFESCTFVNEAAVAIRQWVKEGVTGGPGIFQGMPLEVFINDNSNVPLRIFEGYIDFTKNFFIESPVKVKTSIVKLNGLNDLKTKLSAITYGLLLEKRALVTADFQTVKTVVIKFDQNFENLLLAFLEFTMIRELYFLVLKIESDTANLPLPGAIISLVLDAIYAGLLLIQVVKLGKKVIGVLFPIPSKNLGITFYTALQKACQYLGFDFNTSANILSETTYLPSKPDFNGLTKGIPQAGDVGYTCEEMFEIAMKLCDGKVAVTRNPSSSTGFTHTVQLHNRNAAFWQSTATFPAPDVIAPGEKIEYNTDEYKANRIISFATDPGDEWTVKDYTGATVEIITEPVNFITQQAKPYVLNKGLEKIDIPVALGSTNERLEGFQEALLSFAKEVDKLVAKLGGKSNIAGIISNRGGANLKVSSTTWNVPKVVAVKSDGSLYANQRLKLSARILWDNSYSKSRSFLPANPFGQKAVFKGIKIGFGKSNFAQIINNSYFAGGKGKMTEVRWKFDSDSAICSWWIHEVYTNNLKETIIEP